MPAVIGASADSGDDEVDAMMGSNGAPRYKVRDGSSEGGGWSTWQVLAVAVVALLVGSYASSVLAIVAGADRGVPAGAAHHHNAHQQTGGLEQPITTTPGAGSAAVGREDAGSQERGDHNVGSGLSNPPPSSCDSAALGRGDAADGAILPECVALTQEARTSLKLEIQQYEKSRKFRNKIEEVEGKQNPGPTHVAIIKYLKDKVLLPGWSILELGCAAGGMLTLVEKLPAVAPRQMVGVELVTGWVTWGKEYYPTSGSQISIHEGDITEFQLPPPLDTATFDFVMLNDVMEHMQKNRYGCFFHQLEKVTHPGSVVYMHTPSPALQLKDMGQYYEHVIPHHFVVAGMAAVGFELVSFEYDVDVSCGGSSRGITKLLELSTCAINGWPRYTHSVYRKVQDPKVMKFT